MKIFQQECRKINEETLDMFINKYGDTKIPPLIGFPKITVRDGKVFCEHYSFNRICDKDSKECYLAN